MSYQSLAEGQLKLSVRKIFLSELPDDANDMRLWLLDEIGEYSQGEKTWREALELAERVEGEDAVARASHNLGKAADSTGRVKEAEALYRRRLEIEERLANQSGIATSLHQLGMLAQEQGRIENAEDLYRRSLEIFVTLGSPSAEIARQSLERVTGRSGAGPAKPNRK